MVRAGMIPAVASAPAAMEAAQQLHAVAAHERSPWHSPVPYLFGGLAAMLGLIAFALLLLACSYWKLSSYLEDENGDPEAGGEEGKSGDASTCKLPPLSPEQRIVVIMAGEEKPTFLATPMSSRVSSFDDNAGKQTVAEGGQSKPEGEKVAEEEEKKNGPSSQAHNWEESGPQ